MLYFTTWGAARGCCRHVHRSIEEAAACLQEDHRDCRGESDREIRVLTSRGRIEVYEAAPGAGGEAAIEPRPARHA
jgi:hypothetical protein